MSDYEDDRDPILNWMKRNDMEITRDNYIDLNWSEIPDPWLAEHEDALPESLQDWSQVSVSQGT